MPRTPAFLTLPLSATLCATLSTALAAGPRSALIDASFIDGAEMVSNSPELADFAAALRQVAASTQGTCTRSEYVIWDSQAGLDAQFQRGLNTLGYTYTPLETDREGGYFETFKASKPGSTLVGIWADGDGTTLLGWCAVKTAQAAPAAAASTGKTAWPAFGSFRVGDPVQFYTSTGWRQGVIKEVGPQPGQGTSGNWAAEKKYLITQKGTNWDEYQDWGNVAHVNRAPYWTGFFVGDWTLGEGMAVNSSVSGTTETTTFSYAGASDALRIKADGTYEWKRGKAPVVKGRWTPAPDGPGVVVKDARGLTWTLRNGTNLTEERIRKLESGRLYPSDRSQMSMAATRPLGR